jgi:STE24 endopeptidase
MSSSSAFAAVFVAALALATATRLWLASRHVRHISTHRGRVPDAFAAEIGLDAHQKAADYTCARTRLAMAEVAFSAAVLLALTFGGALQWLHEVSAAWLPEGIGRGLLLLVLVAALMMVLELPFGLYRVFVVETRFGFNKMTPALFFLDFGKSIALSAAFGLPLAAIVLWLMAGAGEYWWFYAWLTWVAFNAFMVAVYPTWIAPLFNRFSPMQDPELKERVERLMARCGFRVKGLMVMDGSRRSTHGNAYFTGFGVSKRIVFFGSARAKSRQCSPTSWGTSSCATS